MAYQWLYATPLSGLSFPLITASGTYAAGYDTGKLSGMISKDGGAWVGLGSRISGIPGNGVFTIASLSSTEMTCYSWIIRITCASGCLDQAILGYNLSGYAKVTDVSGFATLTSVSAGPGILTAVSGVTANVNVSAVALQVWNTVQTGATSTTTFGGMVNISGIGNVLAAISGIPLAVASGFSPLLVAVSNIPLAVASGFSPILTAVSSPATSSIAGQVWNSVTANFTSGPTFAGMHAQAASGITSILAATSNIPLAVGSGWIGVSGIANNLAAISGLANNVSSLPGIMAAVSGIPLAIGSGWVGCSGINGVMVATSGIPSGVASISIQDGDNLTSGTLAHTARLLRWFSWGPLVIDKTYTPNRLYLQTDAVNVSSWWSLTDGVNSTNRARGG